MSLLSPELLAYSKYLTTPLVGAFIGYFTNAVAIKMLFRPLVAWKIGKIRVPMTPGVIPAKRKDLAKNMGEVVGDHLLTSDEIGKGLAQEIFQSHLHALIDNWVSGIMQKDLGPVSSIIPDRFQVYLDLGGKVVIYQLKEQVRRFVESPDFEKHLAGYLESSLENSLSREMESVLKASRREEIYSFIDKNIVRLFASSAMEQWVEDFVHLKVYGALQQEKAISDMIPASLQQFILSSVEKQIPAFLEKLATLVHDQEIREKIVKGACDGVDNFITSLGPMADMVRGFLRMEMVDQKIREYLTEKNADISAWLQSAEMQGKVAAIVREKADMFLQKPVASYLRVEDEQGVEDFCAQCSSQILAMLRGKEVATTLVSMIKVTIETQIDSGSMSLRKVLAGLVGEKTLREGKDWIFAEMTRLVRSDESLAVLDSMVDLLFQGLKQKKIGKLARFIPSGIKDGLVDYLQKATSAMLANEVPGLVHSLNINKIVTEKVNSLDLLRLERLLLSIMEEQFKYINLFGALLGFLIGLLNLLFIH